MTEATFTKLRTSAAFDVAFDYLVQPYRAVQIVYLGIQPNTNNLLDYLAEYEYSMTSYIVVQSY